MALFACLSCRFVLSKDDGTPEMQAVATPIREGAEGQRSKDYQHRGPATIHDLSARIRTLVEEGVLRGVGWARQASCACSTPPSRASSP
jgi:hypothetical protein